MPNKNGLELIKPTSIASTGTGNSSSISANGSVTFSSCATLSLNGVFSSTYDNYMIVCRLKLNSAAGDNISWRLRANGTDNSTASSYTDQYLYADSTTVLGARDSVNYGDFTYSYSGTEMGYIVNIYGPYIAQPTAWRCLSASDKSSALIYDYAGTHNQSTAYDGFTTSNFGGSRTMTGLLAVYGMRN